MVGLLLALAIQGPLTSNDSTCTDPLPTAAPITGVDETTIFEQTTNMDDLLPSDPSSWDLQKYLYISIVLNFFFLIGFLFLVIFVKEDIG